MEEVKYELKKVEVENNSLAITKGYSYLNKDGKQRYAYSDAYYVEGERVCRKHSNERGDFYYNVDLIDVVVETFVTKDGQNGSKVYPLEETPYLAKGYDDVDFETLTNYLKFKLHR